MSELRKAAEDFNGSGETVRQPLVLLDDDIEEATGMTLL